MSVAQTPGNGSLVDALGAFNAVPHIGMIMVNPGWAAVIVYGEAPPATLSVGAGLPLLNRKGATACLAAVDRGSPLQVGVVLLMAASI